MFRYRSSVLYKSKKIFNNLLCNDIDRVISRVISNFIRGTKYIISQHASFTLVISTERVNCIQLSMQQRLLLLFKTFRHSIRTCFKDRCTLLFYKSGIESLSFHINRYSELTAMTPKRYDTTVSGPGCKEYRKVDSVLRSVEEEERYEFTGGHFLKKLMRFKTCITITRTI